MTALPVTGLRSARAARTRIFVAGSDPIFTRPASRTIRVEPAFPDDKLGANALASDANQARLWRPETIDRLQPLLTRYRD